MHRYHDIEYIMALDIDTFSRLILKAKEKEREERIWFQWAIQLPIMSIRGEGMSLQEYREQVTGANIDLRPTEVILEELDAIENDMKNKAER